ncbi:MAG: UDP-N-acetylmuramate dehydrogenase [candidate division WOR-3 bacterium]
MASWRNIIENTLKKSLSRSTIILRKVPLANYTTYKIGGNAEWLFIVNNIQDLKVLRKFINVYDIPFYVIGAGSNLLITDQELKGITIKLGNFFSFIRILSQPGDNKIVLGVGASTRLSEIIKYSQTHSFSGVEFLWGIPGTFGGAIKNNAGAYGHSIGEIILQVNVVDKDGNELNLKKDKINFSYRKTSIPDDYIIISGSFSLNRVSYQEIKNKLSAYSKIRYNTQPRGFSAGSFFKNPPEQPAGKLIEKVGLRGFSYGGAIISTKHANFIINHNQATMSKIYELTQKIKTRVENYTRVILEEEIEILPKTKEVNKWLSLKKLSG